MDALLPVEIWHEIFDCLVLALGPKYKGLRVTLRLRLVSSFFDREIMRAINSTELLTKKTKDVTAPSERVTLDYLRFQVLRKGGGCKSNNFIDTIRTTVRTLIRSSNDPMSDENMYNYTTILSEAVVNLFPTVHVIFTLADDTTIRCKIPGRDYSNILVSAAFPNQIPDEIYPPDSPRHLLPAAACVGNTALVESLLQDIDIGCNDASNYFGTPLHLAVLYGHTDTVKLLLKAGAEPNMTTWDSQIIFHFEYRHWWFTGGDKDQIVVYSITPLQLACYTGRWDIIKILLLPEYSVPLTGFHYHLAILSAIKGNHLDITNYLIDIGDLNSMQPDLLERFWHRALRVACNHGAVDIVQMLLDKGVSVVPPELDDAFPLASSLLLAAGHGFDQIVSLLLLDKGADPDHYVTGPDNRARYTPLQKAAVFGHIKSLQLMLDTGLPSHPHSVIEYAATGGQEHVIRYLIEKGLYKEDDIEIIVDRASRKGYQWIESVLTELGLLEPR
ncbi:hypothetical protein FQN49_007350 [Arthroderma sp. PD_2]|nr:hypothetical protein FQN49_007350 [Arthroderma sp. PD_2]